MPTSYTGACLTAPGSHADAPSPTVSALTGFDPSRVRLAEILYHAEGFTDYLDSIDEAPVWVVDALTAEHSGDCTKQPWSCMTCHAQDYLKIAHYVAERWPLRDSDSSGEAGVTGTGTTEGNSAGPQDIANPSSEQSS